MGVLMDERMKEEVIIDEKIDHHHKCYFSTCGPCMNHKYTSVGCDLFDNKKNVSYSLI
jgi:hypothetical protein